MKEPTPIDELETQGYTPPEDLSKIPGVSDRVRGVVTDQVIVIVFSIIAMEIFSALDVIAEDSRKYVAIFIFGLYDPLFTSLFGGTLGHRFMGLRVRRKSNVNKNVMFPMAVWRYILKILLGWISLLTVSKKRNRNAIHDMAAGSVVVYAEKK